MSGTVEAPSTWKRFISTGPAGWHALGLGKKHEAWLDSDKKLSGTIKDAFVGRRKAGQKAIGRWGASAGAGVATGGLTKFLLGKFVKGEGKIARFFSKQGVQWLTSALAAAGGFALTHKLTGAKGAMNDYIGAAGNSLLKKPENKKS